MINSFTGGQTPGFYIPNPMGYKGPADAYGPYPSPNFAYTPPGSYQPQQFNQPQQFGYPQQQFGYQPQQFSYQPQQFSYQQPSTFNPTSSQYQPQFNPSNSFMTAFEQPSFNFNFGVTNNPPTTNTNINNFNVLNLFNLNTPTTTPETPATTTPAATTPATTTPTGNYDPGVFDPPALSNDWGNNDIPFNFASVASGLFGNIHGMSAILSRFVGDTMPTPQQDPTAPGNTWIFTTMPGTQPTEA